MKIVRQTALDRKIAIGTSVVMAGYCLEVNEKNLIYLALAGINQKNKLVVGEEHKVYLEDFANLLGHKTEEGKLLPYRLNNTKVVINAALKTLYHRTIKLSKGEEHRWLTGYKNLDATGENYVVLKWNPDLFPHLADLKTYANLLARDCVGIKGKYTSRLLELVSQDKLGKKNKERTFGAVHINVDEFLEMIQAPDTYRDYRYLKKFVLHPAIEELGEFNTKTKKGLGIVKIELVDDKRIDRKIKGFTLKYWW